MAERASFAPVRCALFACALAAVLGCSSPPPDATADGAVRELLERLRRLEGNPADARAAYELLSSETKENLVARAKRYSAASGRHIAPELMLAPASFVQRFEPRELEVRIQGRYAIVTALGPSPSHRAEIPCVYEDGAWRVRIELPPLPPVEVRSRDEDIQRR